MPRANPLMLTDADLIQKINGPHGPFDDYVSRYYQQLLDYRNDNGENLLHLVVNEANKAEPHGQDFTKNIARICQAMPELTIDRNTEGITPWDLVRDQPNNTISSLDLASTCQSESYRQHELSNHDAMDLSQATILKTNQEQRHLIKEIQTLFQSTINKQLGEANFTSSPEKARELLHAGADPNAPVWLSGKTPMDIAGESPPKMSQPRNSSETFDLNCSYGGEPKGPSINDNKAVFPSLLAKEALVLIKHIATQNLTQWTQWLENYPYDFKPILTQAYDSENGNSILHALANLDPDLTPGCDSNKIVQSTLGFFEAKKINPDAFELTQNHKGETALHCAAKSDNALIYYFLIGTMKQHKGLLETDNQGNQPYQYAKDTNCSFRKKLMRQSLIKNTQVMAQFQQYEKKPELLLRNFKRCDPSATNHLGNTFLMHAARHYLKDQFQNFHNKVRANYKKSQLSTLNSEHESYWHIMARYHPEVFLDCLKNNEVTIDIDQQTQSALHVFMKHATTTALCTFTEIINEVQSTSSWMFIKNEDTEKPFHKLVENEVATPEAIAANLTTYCADSIVDDYNQTPFDRLIARGTRPYQDKILEALAKNHGSLNNWLTSRQEDTPLYFIERCSKKHLAILAPIVQDHHMSEISNSTTLNTLLSLKPALAPAIHSQLWQLKPITLFCIICLRLLTLPLQIIGSILGIYSWNAEGDCFFAMGNFSKALTNGWFIQLFSQKQFKQDKTPTEVDSSTFDAHAPLPVPRNYDGNSPWVTNKKAQTNGF